MYSVVTVTGEIKQAAEEGGGEAVQQFLAISDVESCSDACGIAAVLNGGALPVRVRIDGERLGSADETKCLP